MTISAARVAGPVLGSYLKQVAGGLFNVAGRAGTKVAETLAANPRLTMIGAGSAEEAAAAIGSIPKVGQYISQLPIKTSTYQKVAPHIPEIAGGLTTMGITAAGPAIINQLAKGVKQELQPFTNQQYVPGSLPMTNYQAGESFLSQQRFQQELALMRAQQYSDQLKYQNQLGILQARQNASSPQGFGYGTGIDLSEDVISAPAQTYQ